MANSAPNTTKQRVRVGGSGFTIFTWQGNIIGFARQIAHTSPTPVGPGAVPIQPMDAAYPIEIITPAAAGPGTLTLELYELYNERVWDRLSDVTKGAIDIVDIFQRVAATEHPISVVKYVMPPTLGGRVVTPYAEQYHNCVISQVLDGETIEIGTMEVLKQITVMYTRMTRNGAGTDTVKGINSSLQDIRNTAL